LLRSGYVGNNMGARCINESSSPKFRSRWTGKIYIPSGVFHMDSSRFLNAVRVVSLILSVIFLSTSAFSQGDVARQTIAVTYPLDETVNVRFRGTTLLPRLKGEAKVKRAGRRGTRVELSVENLPRATELGGPYTTYVLWAISPEGRVDNMGEIKRSGSILVNSKLDVTTPLQTFALIVTAEPHFLVRTPSRMLVLENLPPSRPGNSEIASVSVNYLGNTSDYFKDARIPGIPDAEYRTAPVSLLGARQSVNLAKYAGAERDAGDELSAAVAQLEEAENAWRLKQDESEIDAAARRATSLGVKAEETAEVRKASRQRRDEIARRDAAVRTAEDTAATAGKQIEELRTELAREQRARELAERDAANASEQLRDLRTEVVRLREEVQTARNDGESAKVQLARIEGERQAEQNRINAETQAQRQRADEVTFKQSLAKIGTVRETSRGIVVILPESIWTGPRGSDLSAASMAKVEPLAALLANSPGYQVTVETHTDNRGDQDVLQQLTQERARALAERLVSGGVDGARIQTSGLGASQPVASNSTATGRVKNRRTEVILTATGNANTAAR
jgi:outer membrane protein OmpA-like peptidoglycan-associated protein